MSIHAEAESLLRELLAMPGQLQGAVHAGRRHRRERDRADEPDRQDRQGRLHQHRRLVQEVDQGSQELRQGERGGVGRSQQLHRDPEARRVEARPRGLLRPHLLERDHRRRRVPLDARHRQRAAGGRHVVQHPVAPDRRQPLRPDLRRRAEEHGPVGPDGGDRARRPDRPCTADHALGVQLQAAGRERLDVQHAADLCDLHRRPGVQARQGAGRPEGDGGAQPGQGRDPLRLPGQQRLLPQSGGAAKTVR